MNELARHLGDVMRAQRKYRGFSQEGFADHIGMHRTYYGAVERGEKNTRLSTLQRLAVGFGVSVGELVVEAERIAVVANARRLMGLPDQR